MNINSLQKISNNKKQGGIVIIVVLLIVTLMVTLLAFMVEKQQLLIRRVTNQNVAEQGFQYAEAVNAWAERLLNDDANRESDFLTESWAIFGQNLEEESDVQDADGDGRRDSFFPGLSSGEEEEEEELVVIDIGFDGLEYSIEDLQAKFNLNNLSARDPQFLASQKRIFLNLMEQLEIGLDDIGQRERLYGALLDWVDENDLENVDGGGGTESGSYGAKKTPYYAADQKLSSVGELKFIEGFDSDIISKLKPFVTVLPVDNTKININTASVEMIASLNSAPVVDTASVTAFLAQREADGFRGFLQSDIQAAETAIIGVNPAGTRAVNNMLQVNSQFYQINAKVTLGDYQYCMKTVVLREPIGQGASSTPKISVLRRQQDTLCKEENTTTISSDEDLISDENLF